MRQEVRWTDLTFELLADHLSEACTLVSVPVVKHLLRKHVYVTCKVQKSETMGTHLDGNQQFENIARLKQEYMGSDNSIVSMDTKKKELIGNFYRAANLLTQGVIRTFDHDFPSFASGVLIPHGLYDVKHNDALVNLRYQPRHRRDRLGQLRPVRDGQGVLSTFERSRSCCCVTAAAATFRASTCSWRICNGWWHVSGSRSVWPRSRACL